MDRKYFPLSLCVCMFVYLLVAQFVTPWTVAGQVPLFLGFPRKETGAGCHFQSRESSCNVIYVQNKYADMEMFYNQNYNI